MHQISMNLVSLSELFSQHTFVTPDYQRGYAWQKENVQDFWEDINRVGLNNPEHFTGTLILELDSALNDTQANVVDGQQRLTTAVLLASAIADELATRGQYGAAAKVRANFIGDATAPKFRYGKSHDSWPYLALHVLKDLTYVARAGEFSSAYTQNLHHALSSLKSKLTPLSDAHLHEVTDKLTSKLRFNVVKVDSQKFNIHVAFESINHRGRQLTILELLKNRLIYVASVLPEKSKQAQIRDSVNSTWRDIYSWLGREGKEPLDEDEFLRTHSLMYFPADTSDGKWIDDLLFTQTFSVNAALDGLLSADQIQGYLNSLRLAALLWSHLRHPRNMSKAQILWLERISHVHRPVFDALTLAAYMRCLDGRESLATDLRQLQVFDSILVPLQAQIERFIVLVFYFSGRRSHTGRKEYGRIAYELYSKTLRNKDADAAVAIDFVTRYIKASIANHHREVDGEWTFADNDFPWIGWLDVESFAKAISRALSEGEGYYKHPFTKVLLWEYEDHLRSQDRSDRKVKWTSVGSETIEHIYPQNTEYWTEFTAKLGSRRKKTKINSYQHSLGNLLLLSRSKNSELQNNPYKGKDARSCKRPRFANGGSFSENEIASNYADWTPTSVERRGKMLLRFAEERWQFSFNKLGITDLTPLLVIE
jgi:hypothetical protein